uniref:GST N-terminal domain-containing protein n=1 Tax=Varanus komodoensis TaxID=61221 RepID=A0A8D2J7N1_VARKO
MEPELYLDLLSQPCRAVYIFAKRNNIPFALRDVQLFRGEGAGASRASPGGAGWLRAPRRGSCCPCDAKACLRAPCRTRSQAVSSS